MNTSTPSSVPSSRVVAESPCPDLPVYAHPEWVVDFPWLVQGTTGRGGETELFDLGLFARASPAGSVVEGWRRLQRWTGLSAAVHAHQVHGAVVRVHGGGSDGLHIVPDCDGHATGDADVLLAVTTADCVPVFLVDPATRAVGLLHAGWRSAAGGILEAGLEALRGLGARADSLRMHLGPAICGDCYEVGPEVFQALGIPVPAGPTPVDLRGALAARAASAGVPGGNITVSSHCTLCGDSPFFSHRGGDGQRQVGFLGVRP